MRPLRFGLIALIVVAVAVFSAAVFGIVDALDKRLGPAIARDLAWMTGRGAAELAGALDVAMVVADRDLIEKGAREYRQNADVLAIAVHDAEGQVIYQHGTIPGSVPGPMAGAEGDVHETSDALYAWNAAEIEGTKVGRVALVMSKRRLHEMRALLSRIKRASGASGALALLGGLIVVIVLTGAVERRDAELAAHAAGLEEKVRARTRELDEANRGMRLVLDNVAQGLVTVGLDGKMESERSAMVDAWLGTPDEGMAFSELLERVDPEAAAWLRVGMQAMNDAIFPMELLLDQLPKTVRAGERTLAVKYEPIESEGELRSLLVVMRDATEEIERARLDAERRELIDVVPKLMKDSAAFEEFLVEGARLVDSAVASTSTRGESARALHTLKGNAAMFACQSIASVCHRLEQELSDGRDVLSPQQCLELRQVWEALEARLEPFRGTSGQVSIELEEYERMLARLRSGAIPREILRAFEGWRFEPVEDRFERLAVYARSLSERLGKPGLFVEIEAAGLKLEPKAWGAFWAELVHAIRNAVDHGIEEPERRTAAGKEPVGRLELRAACRAEELVISIADDGRGIDWNAIGRKARSLGLPHETKEDLEVALFSSGVTTREAATEVSGRGIGLCALKREVDRRRGRISIETRSGSGTEIAFRFPLSAAVSRAA